MLQRQEHVPGIPRSVRAVDLADGRAESWLETHGRLAFAALGLPPFTPQVELRVERRLVKVVDGWYSGAALAIEFDGAGHRERKQHRADNVREEGFERAGLVVARADSLDLTAHRDELARRLRAAHTDALRNRRPVRWTLAEPSWWRGLPA